MTVPEVTGLLRRRGGVRRELREVGGLRAGCLGHEGRGRK